MRTLPKEISPNPLVTSVIEIKFDSNIEDDDILNSYYSLLINDFPKIAPKTTKNSNKELGFIFSNEKYFLSIGKGVISFEHINEYTLWDNYYNTIKKVLSNLANGNILSNVSRIGLRYISLFENQKIEDCLNFNIQSNIYNRFVRKNKSFIQLDLNTDLSKVILQIGDGATINKGNSFTKTGLYIDIDVSRSEFDVSLNLDSIIKTIDDLHSEEKEIFISLLNDKFYDSLNTKY